MPISLQTEPLRRGERRDAIVQSLLGDIFHGRLQAGQHLVTQELAQRFGVSHTPIREALITLGGIGLLTLQPNRGAVVRQISSREVREVCRVRRALECEAVRGAVGRIPLKPLQSLDREFTRLQAPTVRGGTRLVQRARELDSELHDLIAQSAGNTFLIQELNRLKLLFRAFRDVAWEYDSACNGYHRLNEEAREHGAITQALLKQQRQAALTAMSRHIRSGMTYWSQALPPTESSLSRSILAQRFKTTPEVR
ncbi:GntR family transcriptional regulator [bacterium]|nr:GntR family transcriptional regulator [bacterium]